ncbi:hypothetical protein DMUE_4114 [Dictyocoela muelleri]|nr:hypothetical protein EQH57_0051 [Dictyocoela roeselum]KAG0436654.1 hypothetical protein DMUE_4114 [Dictyocoela muelleri]
MTLNFATEQDRINIQRDLKKLVDWTDTWKMNLSIDKCTVMHIGSQNRNSDYVMADQNITEVDQQRDLGILITKDPMWKNQMGASYKKGNRVIGFISRNFQYKSWDIVLPLYTSLVSLEWNL